MAQPALASGLEVIRPEGRITASNAEEFKAVVQQRVADGASNVVVDLAGVDLIDSRGLAAFLVCHQALASRGGTLTLKGADENLRGLFKVIHLDQHLRIEE